MLHNISVKQLVILITDNCTLSVLCCDQLSIQNHDTDGREQEDEAAMEGDGEGGEGVGGEGVEGEGGDEARHLPNPEASQDTELVATGSAWEGRGEASQEPGSPHLARKSTWSQGTCSSGDLQRRAPLCPGGMYGWSC